MQKSGNAEDAEGPEDAEELRASPAKVCLHPSEASASFATLALGLQKITRHFRRVKPDQEVGDQKLVIQADSLVTLPACGPFWP